MTVTEEATPIEADEIDLEFVPCRREGTAEIEVGDDLVVVAEAFTIGVLLNPSAALVWRCLDGETSVGELIAELDEATGAGVETIGDDVLGTVRALGSAMLLTGVVHRRPPTDERSASLAVGDTLEPFTLPDLDGRPVTIGSSTEGRLLLVNWSPFCGFCTDLSAEVMSLRAELGRRGVDLVFLTTGDPDANLDVFDSDDPPTALLRPAPEEDEDDDDGHHHDHGDGDEHGHASFADPFAALGTPAAYLLDDGTLAEPLAYGAVEVSALTRRLAGLDTEDADGRDEREPESSATNRILYLPVSGAACAPGASGATRSVWDDRRVLRVADHHVGVQCNTVATAAILDRFLPGVVVDDDDAPSNFSIVLQPPTMRGARALNLLVRDGEQLVRSRSAARVLHALLSHISGAVGDASAVAPADPALIRVGSLAAVRDGRAVLLPMEVKRALKAMQPRLFRLGLQLVDVPWASVDSASRELVVPEPGVGYDPSVLDEVARGVRLGAELPYVPPGRYPIDVWYVVGLPGQVGPAEPAMALSCTVGLIDATDDLQSRVEELAALLAALPVRRMWWETYDALTVQLAAGLTH